MLEFTFLGTSSGVPTLQRNVSGLVVKKSQSKEWCLVDCGEGTQQQLLRTPHSLAHLDTILITHVHGDHCYGLPGLLATAAMVGRKKTLKIIAPYGIEEYLRKTMHYTDMHIDYPLEFLRTENLDIYKINQHFVVRSTELSHRVPSYAYCFDEIVTTVSLDIDKLNQDHIPRGPAWGQIAKQQDVTLEDGRHIVAESYHLAPGKPFRVVVGGDNDSPQRLQHVTAGADVLIHEATYTEAICQKTGPEPQHSSAMRVAKFAQTCGVPNLILTHFSARYHRPDASMHESIEDIEREAKQFYTGRLFLARDFNHFTFDKARALHLHKIG